MKHTAIIVSATILLAVGVAACAFDIPTQSAKLSESKPSGKGDVKQLDFRVAADRVSCQGAHGDRTCLRVNGDLFYDTIDGYAHIPGKARVIHVERTQICDPAIFNDCPQDAGIYRYRLLKVIK